MNQPTLPIELPAPSRPPNPPTVSLAARLNPNDLLLVLFESGIETSAIWAHATQRLAQPDARPDPNCLLCIGGILLGAWPPDHHPQPKATP